MDEQIKPVAWIMPSAMKALNAGGSAMVGGADQGIDLPLYSQQSIDALMAEVDEQCRLHAIGMERELALIARAERAESEAEALRADAERYRWLRDSPGDTGYWLIKFHGPGDPALDAAIDASRKGAE